MMATARSSRLGLSRPSISSVTGLWGNNSAISADASNARRIPITIVFADSLNSVLSLRNKPIEIETIGFMSGASTIAPIITAALFRYSPNVASKVLSIRSTTYVVLNLASLRSDTNSSRKRSSEA